MEQYRNIVIIGTCGSGKSTLAGQLSKKLGIPHIELDALHWLPYWEEVEREEFRERVKNLLDIHPHWVIDGNYSKARDLIWPKADLIIWLDYPLPLILWRLLKRSLQNRKIKKELWPGCQTSLRRDFLTKDSIFLWALKSYRKKKRIYPPVLSSGEYAHLNILHVRSPRELVEVIPSYTRL